MTSTPRDLSLTRRGFFRAAGAVGVAAALTTRSGASAEPEGLCRSTVPDAAIGIQLFTCTGLTAVNRDAALERIAALGYKFVEHAGYGGNAAAFRASLDRYGLRSISGHTALARPYNETAWAQVVADAKVIGQRYVVWPSNSANTVDQWIDVANTMNAAGRFAYRAGMGRYFVGFHNHGREYQPIAGDAKGRRPIDILMAYCHPKYTHQQMDIGWCWSTSDPVAELHRFPGRYRQFHVKDMVGVPHSKRHLTNGGNASPVVPGAGLVDFRAVFAAAKESDQPIESFLVENDTSIATCLDAAAAGYQTLHGMEYQHTCRPPLKEPEFPDDEE